MHSVTQKLISHLVYKVTVVWVVYVCSHRFVCMCLTFYFETITGSQKCSKNTQIHFLPELLESKLLPWCPVTPAHLSAFPTGTVSFLPTGQLSRSGREHWYPTHHGIRRSHSGSVSCPNNVLYRKGQKGQNLVVFSYHISSVLFHLWQAPVFPWLSWPWPSGRSQASPSIWVYLVFPHD